jgi:hypothetical protein
VVRGYVPYCRASQTGRVRGLHGLTSTGRSVATGRGLVARSGATSPTLTSDVDRANVIVILACGLHDVNVIGQPAVKSLVLSAIECLDVTDFIVLK